MFKHSIKLIYRNILRFKSSFFINLIGLSAGLACVLLIFLWVEDELSIDRFHEKDSQLYQVMLNHQNTDGLTTAPSTPALLAESLKEEMPEVDYAVATTTGIEMPLFLLSVGEKNIKASGHFVGKDFFNIFSYELIQGDRNKVLSDKSSIAISEALALKLFGTTENILGKPLKYQHEEQYTISGIFESPPQNSSDQFDFLLPFEVYKAMMGESAGDWGSTAPRTFLLLQKDADVQAFNAKMAGFIKSKDKRSNAELFLRPYGDRYLYNEYVNGEQAGGRIAYVKLFSIIAVFILLIACINFMNLSTAKASRRFKEVGIKKTLGARRSTLIFQYLGESMAMSVVSLLIALVFVLLFLPQFNELTGKQLSLTLTFGFLLSMLSITLFTGLMAGSYPALFLSGFKPVAVLKGGGATTRLIGSAGEGWTRKGLVVFQFTLSVIFIVAILVVHKQINYVQTKSLGYDRDNIIYFEKEGKVEENAETFLSEVRNIPGIKNASATSHNLMGNKSKTSGMHWEGKNPNDMILFEIAWVDYELLETLDIDLAEGRSFSADFSTDSTKIIFNEAAIEVMGLQDPIGKTVNLWGKDRQIVGVTKNVHFESLHEGVKPMFFIIEPAMSWMVMAKVEAGMEQQVIPKLQELYTAFNPGFPFEFKFLDTTYQAQYIAEQRVSALSRYFAGLAILISCLGLYGLTAFAAEQRRKEIGIRKVLGASVSNIMTLLSKDFIKLVFISIVVGSILAWIAMSQWLEGFAYRIEMGWWVFGLAGAAAMLIALCTVSYQAVKAAKANPVKNLRAE